MPISWPLPSAKHREQKKLNFFHALFVDPSKRISWDVVREIIHQKWLSFNLESRGNEEKGKT